MIRQPTFTEVNMTPLVDVMLVVLVLFMITSPLLLSGPEVNLPRASATVTPVSDKDLVLTVTRQGRVHYRDEDVTGRVGSALSGDRVLREVKQLYIRGDRDVSFGVISAVMAEARAASVGQLNLVIDPELIGEGDRGPNAVNDTSAQQSDP
jgi:biopolymer transport protein TolR